MAAPTQQDLFLVGRAEAVSLPTRFDRAIIDTDGSDVNVVLNVGATMGEEVAAFHQAAQNARSLATVFGEDLDRWAWDTYKLRRQDEAPAIVTLELARSSTSGAGFAIPALSPFGTPTGQTYLTLTPTSFANGSNGPLYVTAIAETAGAAGNVPEGSITVVKAALPDTTVTVTNPDVAAGGAARQLDGDFKDTCRQFFLTARRGTRAAIEYGATLVPQVAQASATEVLDPAAGIPVYRVRLVVADPQGQANAALGLPVVTELDEYRALGVPVLLVPATPQYVSIRVVGVQFEAGTNTSQALADARQVILALVNNLRPGPLGKLYRADILAALSKIPGLKVPNGALLEPAGDLVPTTGTVIRTSPDLIEVLP